MTTTPDTMLHRLSTLLSHKIVMVEAERGLLTLRSPAFAEEAVRELLANIRTPSEAMVESQLKDLKRFGPDVTGFARSESVKVWQEMLDALLTEKSPAEAGPSCTREERVDPLARGSGGHPQKA